MIRIKHLADTVNFSDPPPSTTHNEEAAVRRFVKVFLSVMKVSSGAPGAGPLMNHPNPCLYHIAI